MTQTTKEPTVKNVGAVKEEITDIGRFSEMLEEQKRFEKTLEHRIIGLINQAWKCHRKWWIDVLSFNGLERPEWETLGEIPEGECVIVFRGHKRDIRPVYLNQYTAPTIDPKTRRAVCHALTHHYAVNGIAQRLAGGHDGWLVMLIGTVEKNEKAELVFKKGGMTSTPAKIEKRLAELKEKANEEKSAE